MSPAYASAARSRSPAIKVTASEMLTFLPIRTWSIFIPWLYLPDTIRIKAIRSRCLGSIFAWILNTKPENFSSSASTWRSAVSRGWGAGAHAVKPSNIWSTPKLPSAVPKNTGVSSPAKNSSWSNSCDAPTTSSSSSRNCSASSSPTASSSSWLSKPLTIRTSWIVWPWPVWYRTVSSRWIW